MILCCGESLIDMIQERTVSDSIGYVPRSGGAIFNTAIALGRLGCDVGILTGISFDIFGQQLLGSLAESNVRSDFVVRSDRPSTIAFVHLKNGQANYSFFDENSAGSMVQFDDLPSEIANIEALYFGGISLACNPAADAYLRFAEAHCDRRVIMVDPNIRENFIEDEIQYRDRLERLFKIADIVKVSDEDLDWLVQGPEKLEVKVIKLLQFGPSIVVATKGSRGAEAWTSSGHHIAVRGKSVDVVDTVGAGDTFNAGFLTSLFDGALLSKTAIRTMQQIDLEKALELGTTVAAINIGKAGANPPWRNEL